MKKLALFFIVLASIVVLFTCNVALAQTVICGTPEELTLYADQTIDVGTITAYNDSDNLYVKYTTTGGWVLDETHLAVATSLDDIPQKNGNPVVGHFPYKSVHSSVTEYVYVINLEDAGYTVDTELYIAAHADVSLIDDYGNIVQEEGAWGSGNNFPGKNWAVFFTYSVQLGNQALLGGGLSKAEVRAYRLSDLKNPIEGPVVTSESSTDISGAGLFSLQLSGLPEDEYILLAVSNGKDTDADGNGVFDSTLTSNMGTIHALVTVSEINNHNIRISPITDIAWQFAKNLVEEVNDNGLQIRLNDIAQILFKEDISGDKLINSQEISVFSPLDNTHKQKLNFNYQSLFAKDGNGNSIIGSYHTGQEDTLLDLLKNAFGIKLTLYPDRDFRNKAVKLEVLGFGRGSFRSNVGGINFDSERTSGENTNHDFYDPDKTDAVTITAIPIPETEILGWNGCDVVSEDMTQCQCVLARDRNRQVRVSFGYKETKVVPNLVDLSRTEVIRDNYTLHVTVGHGDDEMVAKMADLSEDNYVVGFADRGFLLKVLTVNKISDYKYTLTTDEASLEEVIQQGTGVLTKQMTHGDLVNNVNSGQDYLSESTKAMLTTNDIEAAIAGPTPATPIQPKVEFSAIDGVRLLPSDNPEEKIFTIQIGRSTSDQLNAENAEDYHWEDVVIWDNENGVQVKVNGTIDLEILLDVGVSYGIISGLEDFRFVPTVKATENLTLTITGEFDDILDEPVASIPFGHLSFFIGPIPVWITFQLDVSVGGEIHVIAEATTGVGLEQTITAGVHYQKSTGGFHPVKEDFRKSWTFDEPNIEAELYAKAFVKPTGKILLYGKTGPAVRIEPYLELIGQLASDDALVNTCQGGINFLSRFGLKGDFYWVFSADGDTKLGKFLHLDELEDASTFNILKETQWTISKWNYGGECGLKNAFLKVVGPHLCETLKHGSGEVINQDYILTNTGDLDLPWSIEYFFRNGITSVSQTSGVLAKHEPTTVTVSVDTNQPIGSYLDVIWFKNNIGGFLRGSTFRAIAMRVIPTILAPELTEPTLFSPTIVQLSWDYPDDSSKEFVDGYWIFQSTDNENWEQIATVTNANETTWLVTKLLTDKTYYFSMISYNNDYFQSDVSETVAIYVPKIEPGGDCRAHFSGALMSDHFMSGWLSEVYVEDQYSEYVGAGKYPLNLNAFPKATMFTFDGIAIDAGTKVTVYSQPNFEGEILYEKIGPAIINNGIWKNYPQVSSVMADWKEPLQTNYPQSVREWSDTNMHNWPSGSMIIECGY